MPITIEDIGQLVVEGICVDISTCMGYWGLDVKRKEQIYISSSQ